LDKLPMRVRSSLNMFRSWRQYNNGRQGAQRAPAASLLFDLKRAPSSARGAQ
jgi:hypothetical protein